VSGGGLGKRGEADDWTPAVAIVEREFYIIKERKGDKGGSERTTGGIEAGDNPIRKNVSNKSNPVTWEALCPNASALGNVIHRLR
jgi:hypothetical protein